ncbi:hypothetical protein BJ165DRAFT_667129 [Panaeolus papilionaceus]|nr:hypothetical protein BJ165DRAFT_667129 [Panaeolus papilionaceus]
MVCLYLAIASIGRAMQRSSNNRQHLVVQAMAFLTKYRKMRGTTTVGVREVEYNFERELYLHAAKHYGKCWDWLNRRGMTVLREKQHLIYLVF